MEILESFAQVPVSAPDLSVFAHKDAQLIHLKRFKDKDDLASQTIEVDDKAETGKEKVNRAGNMCARHSANTIGQTSQLTKSKKKI